MSVEWEHANESLRLLEAAADQRVSLRLDLAEPDGINVVDFEGRLALINSTIAAAQVFATLALRKS